MDELEVLRLRMIAAAVPDPGREWDSSSAYATVDKRILTPEDVERSIGQAEDALRRYVAFLHDGLRPVFHSFFAGDPEGTARHLVALGERHEESGRARGARQCYEAAATLALPLADRGPLMLAMRRLGRVALSLGEFQEAISHYERSVQLARDSGDLRAELVGRTGVGNVAVYQGRWVRAQQIYTEALEQAETDPAEFVMERGQLFNNLGNVATRMNRLAEAETWLQRGLELWQTVDSPMDHAVCRVNLGHLREQQGRHADAREAYETAMALPVPASIKALAAADLAATWLQEGYVAQAEELARISEEHAIQSGSPYTLGYMYRNLGNLARARGDEDGFTFYEKALQIAREKGYPSLEAETLADYAELRRRSGGMEEAQAYLEHARQLFEQLGSPQKVSDADRVLAEIRVVQPPEPGPREEEPLAAAGD
jgi:tetratricopeptide (TPR) repeat protein